MENKLKIKCEERIAYVYTNEQKIVYRSFYAILQQAKFLIYGQKDIHEENNKLIIEGEKEKQIFYNCKFSIVEKSFEILLDEKFNQLTIEEQIKDLRESYIVECYKKAKK